MGYKNLFDFIQNRMRMSHIYQPVMLMTLLNNDGHAHTNEIARAFLLEDESQIDYYSYITRSMPGRVLSKHKIIRKEGDEYFLNDFTELTSADIEELLELCKKKLDDYIEKRGSKIWQHRKKSAGYISGSKRYVVLKRAKFRCELCGVPADERALEVDHIIPRNKGGGDEIENLQALCYSCNSMKRDKDDTDFRAIRKSYDSRDDGCVFCNIEVERIVRENTLAYVIRDAFKVTDQHTLIIPKRHVSSYFDLGRPELNACNELLLLEQEGIKKADSSVKGFNIGMNIGAVAGQTIFHVHIHLIPRRAGDVQNPRGGIRNVIPGKGDY